MRLKMYNVGNCVVGDSEVDVEDVHELLALLIEKYGEDTMMEVIKNHEDGQNFSDAFKNVLLRKNMIAKLKVKKSI